MKLLERLFYSAGVEWVRRWHYELRWSPGHAGVLNRTVDSLGQLRAVVEWARRNPHVEKCSYHHVDDLEGARIEVCGHGHSLKAINPLQPYRLQQEMRLARCRDCPGHYVTVCPTCDVYVYDPPLGPDCGPQVTAK
jgi:hypothetical protein